MLALKQARSLLALLLALVLVLPVGSSWANPKTKRGPSAEQSSVQHRKGPKQGPKAGKGKSKGKHGNKNGSGKKHKDGNKGSGKKKKKKNGKRDKRKLSRAARLDRRTPTRTLPVPRRVLGRADLRRKHHDYPAWDTPVARGTPVFAMRAGVVLKVTKRGACGRGVIIRGKDGFIYTYCHGSYVRTKRGRRVSTGATIMRSGNSGRSTGPHLHLQIRSRGGSLRCPQKLLRAEWKGRMIPTKAAPRRGCSY